MRKTVHVAIRVSPREVLAARRLADLYGLSSISEVYRRALLATALERGVTVDDEVRNEPS